MQIKNYTSEVAAETTISRIELKLAAVGASGIMKLYGPDKKVSALIFSMPHNNKNYSIKVPANTKACYDFMWREYCQSHSSPRESAKPRIMDQACRTAWKLVQEWIEVQVSMIVMKQAEALEVFMPYVWDGKKTHFQTVMDSGFKALPERCE